MQVNMKFLRSHCDFFFWTIRPLKEEKKKDKIIKNDIPM